ncbi:MAG: hypothetical protein ABR529_03270 [Actinomycetota bacterium]
MAVLPGAHHAPPRATERALLERAENIQRRLFHPGDDYEHGGGGGATTTPSQADNFEIVGHWTLTQGGPYADVYLYDHGGDVGK